MKNAWFGLLFLGLLAGCSSMVHEGGARRLEPGPARVFLAPFFNATDDDHASRALTEITASELFQRGVPLVQTEPTLVKSRSENAAGQDGLFLETARSLAATHLLIGTVHEYRYKTDLDGDPAVGVSLRLVDAKDGRTLWQGSSANVSVVFASVTKAAQRAVRDLVAQMPLAAREPDRAKPRAKGKR